MALLFATFFFSSCKLLALFLGRCWIAGPGKQQEKFNLWSTLLILLARSVLSQQGAFSSFVACFFLAVFVVSWVPATGVGGPSGN